MSLVVPFDGSELSRVALVRAVQFDTVLNEGVVAVSVIPDGKVEYARERGWIDDDEQFDLETVTTRLANAVESISPDVRFRYLTVDRWAPSGTIANKLRRFARDVEASILFVGSENAGRIVSSLSVGSSITTDSTYDTMIISTPAESGVEELERELPTSEAIR